MIVRARERVWRRRADGAVEEGGFPAVHSMSLDFDFGSEADLRPPHRTGSSLGFGRLPGSLEAGEAGLGQGIALVVDAEVRRGAGCAGSPPPSAPEPCSPGAGDGSTLLGCCSGDLLPHDGRAVARAQAALRHAV